MRKPLRDIQLFYRKKGPIHLCKIVTRIIQRKSADDAPDRRGRDFGVFDGRSQSKSQRERETQEKSKPKANRDWFVVQSAGHPSSAPRAREAGLSSSRTHPSPRCRRPTPVPHGTPGPAPAVRRSSGLPLPSRSGLLLLHVQPHFTAEHDGLQKRERRTVTSCV